MQKAIFIGRFQPLHKGHCYTIHNILKRKDITHLYIIIGSAHKKDKDNPYPLETRKRMIENTFRNYIENKKISIHSLADCPSDSQWIENLQKTIPDFSIAFSGNLWTERCLKPMCKVTEYKFHNKDTWNGTYIRSMIKKKKDIKDLVPEEVLEIIKDTAYL